MSISSEQIADTFVQERLSLTGLAWALVRDHHLAEDAVQDALAGAFKKTDSFESTDHVRNWLRQAVRLRAIDLYRKRGHQAVVFDSDLIEQLSEDWDELALPNTSDMVKALEQCINGLSPRAIELVRLRYRDNADLDHIAAALGYKIESVYSTLSRVRKALADCIMLRLGRKA